MNERKLNQLFSAARREPSPVPQADFADDVLRAVRNDRGDLTQAGAWTDALTDWFPRLAWGAALFIALCIGVEFGAGTFGLPTVNDGLNQVSQEWLFTLSGG